MPSPSLRTLPAFAALACALAQVPSAEAAFATFAAIAQPDSAGNFVLRWPSGAGQRYVVESSADLATWAELPGEIAGDGSLLATTVQPAGADAGPRRFWRIAALATTGAPVIHRVPTPQTVTEGLVATFRVTAGGAPPLTYRWYRNGEFIASAASAWYTTSLATVGDSGANYTVTITNAQGSITSAPIALTVQPYPADAAAPRLDTAQRSGVVGYPIGIFGSRFGTTPGTVRILGATATVTHWSDGLIKATVPAVPAGEGDLAVETAAGTARSPFIVYAVDPRFLRKPVELENLVHGRPVVIHGTYNYWSYSGTPDTFLTHNLGNGTAEVSLSPASALAIDLGAAVSGNTFFTFQIGGSWYENDGAMPRDYTVEASSDSSNGLDGNWSVLAAITGNTRNNRIHPVTFSGQRWMRWRVTASANGPTFRVNEIRLFRPKAGSTGTGHDIFGLMGDSNTANDFGSINGSSTWNVLRTLKGDGTQPLTFIMGLSGQNTGGLRFDLAHLPVSLASALQLQPELRFVGIALGTNGAGDDWMGFEIRENYEQGIQQILAAGKVPIFARVPETHGWGTPNGKRRALAYVDDLAAQYRLIPGPDSYTPFRENLEAFPPIPLGGDNFDYPEGSFLSDGVHHSEAGGATANRLWAEALVRSGIYSTPAP
ncbi:MAG: hypothetical protein IPL39_11305 [Opitutaceae bacterium]|nr:hypothetical protein [Opitutaceae bacterium]